MAEEEKNVMTTAAGPVGDNQNSLTLGPRGPVVFEDFLLFEKMARFNRDAFRSGWCMRRVPAHTDISYAASAKEDATFIGFSRVGGKKGSADT